MRKFQLDPAGPPVVREAPPQPSALRPPPSAPSGPEPVAPGTLPLAKAPRRSRALLVWIVLGVLALGAGGTVGALYLTDSGPFKYPDAYLLEEDETPDGMRLEALPSLVREELGVDENPDRLPDEKKEEFIALDDRPDVLPEEVWVESIGNGRFGEQVIIAAARMETEDDAVTLAGTRANGCNGRDGAGVSMRDGKVVVIVIAIDDSGASRVRAVDAALREKTPDLTVACRW